MPITNAQPIKTATEVVSATSRLQRKLNREKRQHSAAVKAEQARLEYYGDLRDDVMSLVRNSTKSFEDIEAECGPVVGTLERWDAKEVGMPQLRKLQATLRIIGFDIGIIQQPRKPAA